MPAVELEGVEFAYRGRPALRGVSFAVESGAMAALLGPNGGGKTTIFRILCTLLIPPRGTVRVLGAELDKDPFRIRRTVGVVFQTATVDPELTVMENLRHQGHIHGLRGPALRQRIRELLERFGLEKRAGHLVKHLSGGLQRRVDLARALLHRPRILLLDEPTVGLDPKVSREFWMLLTELNQEGVTVLLTTHSLDEADRCGYLVILADGRVVAKGSPADLRGRIGEEVVVIRSSELEGLAREISDLLGVQPQVVDGQLRIRHPAGHHLVADLVQRYGSRIDSITVSRPTLEDVFIRETGQAFH